VKGGALVAPNREIAVLKALFNRCLEWKKYEGGNPVSQVKLLREPKGRLRYLEPEEEEKLLEAAREPLRTLILLGINTGLRLRAEALTLQRSDVDLNRGLLTVQAAYGKSGESRTVNMNMVMRNALRALFERTKGPYVFCNRDGKPFGSIRNAFNRARKKAGLGDDVTPHTLRHTFASRLAMVGEGLRTVQELGGWKTLDLVQRYSHLSPSHKAQAVERISRENFEANSPTPLTTPVKGAATA
jgi:integrase